MPYPYLNFKTENNKEDFDKIDEKDRITIVAYKNGFVMNNEPFRDFSDEKNVKFMKEIESGYVPQELVQRGFKNIGVALDDKRKEEYKPPVPEKKFEAFKGEGKTMSGVKSQAMQVNKDLEFKPNMNEETTKVSIRLHTGETVVQTFNLTTTLEEVYRFVEK